MKKNVGKLSALGLSIVAAVAILVGSNGANAQQTGEVSLTIDSGSSYCVYGTSIDLGSKSVATDFGALTFSGNLNTSSGTNTWSCTDFAGTTGGWDLTIQSTDLTNETSNVISSGNIVISHDAPALINGTCTTGGNAATDVSIGSTHTIMAKAASANRTVCSIDTANVALKVNVPANQAPGKYTGTLTITVPVFN